VGILLLLALGLALPSAKAEWAPPSDRARLPGLTVEVVSSGCRDGEPYLEYLVTNKSSMYYVLAAVGFITQNGDTAEVTTGGGGYYILQSRSTASFAPTFPEIYEGQTVLPYVHLYPYYKSEFVYASPVTVPTCPGSPPTTEPSGTATTVPQTTVPSTTAAGTSTTAAPTSVTVLP
jgi:hypothetical protein